MYKSLQKYIDQLISEGELVTIETTVDTQSHEIWEIVDRVCKSKDGGKALLFTNNGHTFPILVNMFGSDKRMAMALGVKSLNEIPSRIDDVIRCILSPKATLWQKARTALQASRWLPRKSRKRGTCQQVIYQGEQADLDILPYFRCAPHDGGKGFITLPMVNTIDPVTGVRNVGMYRMQIVDNKTTGMHWQIHKTGERHYRAYQQAGIRKMPVSVCLGGDPAYTFAATAPMPDGMDEYLLAGFLRGKPVKLVKCLTNDIYVPEDCDFVIEGWVDTTEDKFIEGPFGDHTGFYSLEDLYPRFHISAITHRKDAVYPATIVGVPPMEDAYIAKASERIFLAPIRLVMQPEIEDMRMPEPGVAHNLAFVSIKESYAGQARKVGFSLLGAGQMMFTKYLGIMPAGSDIHDTDTLAKHLRSMSIPNDIEQANGVYDALDHATANPGTGGKLIFDLTTPRKERNASLPDTFNVCEGITTIDSSLVKQWSCLIVRADYRSKIDIEEFIRSNQIEVNFIALFDNSTSGLTPYELLWLGCGNSEPNRDATIINNTLVVDCRTKVGCAGAPQRFPNVVTSDEETRRRVDARWKEYGLGELLPSPSDHFEPLVHNNDASVK